MTTFHLVSPSNHNRNEARRGRLTSVTDPLSRVTSYEYYDEGRITKVTQPDPDGAGSLASPVITTAYNAVGLVTNVADPCVWMACSSSLAPRVWLGHAEHPENAQVDKSCARKPNALARPCLTVRVTSSAIVQLSLDLQPNGQDLVTFG